MFTPNGVTFTQQFLQCLIIRHKASWTSLNYYTLSASLPLFPMNLVVPLNITGKWVTVNIPWLPLLFSNVLQLMQSIVSLKLLITDLIPVKEFISWYRISVFKLIDSVYCYSCPVFIFGIVSMVLGKVATLTSNKTHTIS